MMSSEMSKTIVPQLPDDVITHILERVPDSIMLFRCSIVCKQWCHLVADPVFLRCRWPDTSSSALIGFSSSATRPTSARRGTSL
ncbi:hypothetical protein PR202_gb25440 [Eleusine coracana subsp. coracana]|uniref:F-box domain-containing protein n=1 Tax=Eleusine coracana subsp. coracana TaxID=191504 RepID=A0AAV5FNI8_ELECO|nr:hypothetical protein PR202_gb25440 [Eleusine coracana subsp. coracana]